MRFVAKLFVRVGEGYCWGREIILSFYCSGEFESLYWKKALERRNWTLGRKYRSSELDWREEYRNIHEEVKSTNYWLKKLGSRKESTTPCVFPQMEEKDIFLAQYQLFEGNDHLKVNF